MKTMKMICAALLCMRMGISAAVPVQAERFAAEPLVVNVSQEGEEPDAPNQEQQVQTGIFYLMPSVVMAVVLTIIVMRQKKANRNR